MNDNYQPDDNGMCQNCGTNHLEELRRVFPDLHYLRSVEQVIRNTEVHKEIPEAFSRFAHSLVNMEMDEFVMTAMQNGEGNGREAAQAYASLCLEVGFLIGNMTQHHFALGYDVPLPSTDEIESAWEEVLEANKEHEEEVAAMQNFDQEKALEVLKEAGLIPKDAKVSVIGVNLEQIRKMAAERGQENGEGGSTGMYL